MQIGRILLALLAVLTFTNTYSAEQLTTALKWRMIGPFRGGRTRAVAGVPSLPNVFYIGAVDGGVWKTDDAAKLPKPYNTLEFSDVDGLRKVVKSAGRTLVLVSGGSKMGDDATIHKARIAMEAGCVGLIFGRNMWQRKWDDAVSMASRMHELMKGYGQ